MVCKTKKRLTKRLTKKRLTKRLITRKQCGGNVDLDKIKGIIANFNTEILQLQQDILAHEKSNAPKNSRYNIELDFLVNRLQELDDQTHKFLLKYNPKNTSVNTSVNNRKRVSAAVSRIEKSQ